MTTSPTEIRLHSASRMLELEYESGERFELSCEYLRVFSPSVEVRGLGELVAEKEDVALEAIEPVGNYAVRLYFDDGHKSGVYSWEHLYDLAVNQARYWREYLDRLRIAELPHRSFN